MISQVSGRSEYVASGVIRIRETLTLADRLKTIFDSVCQIVTQYQPGEVAVEQIFMAKSAGSALKLGQARGAIIVAATSFGLPVSEYEARKVKQAVTGTGAADKTQVQHMVRRLLTLPQNPQEDAADALAVALCHAVTQQHLVRISASRFRRGRFV